MVHNTSFLLDLCNKSSFPLKHLFECVHNFLSSFLCLCAHLVSLISDYNQGQIFLSLTHVAKSIPTFFFLQRGDGSRRVYSNDGNLGLNGDIYYILFFLMPPLIWFLLPLLSPQDNPGFTPTPGGQVGGVCGDSSAGTMQFTSANIFEKLLPSANNTY